MQSRDILKSCEFSIKLSFLVIALLPTVTPPNDGNGCGGLPGDAIMKEKAGKEGYV